MPERLRRVLTSPWLAGLVLGLIDYARRVGDVLTMPIQRFDEGIQLSSGWFVSQGELPLRDFYQPYGPGFGIPGAIGHWLFGEGILANRLIYAAAPAAVVVVAYVFITRRRGWPFGLALALLCMASSVPRYAFCWLAILGGLLIVDRTLRQEQGGSLGAALAARPRVFLAAGLVMASAAWVRGEYTLFIVGWGLVVLYAGRELPRRPRLLIAGLPVLFALLPYLVVVLAGGLTELMRWGGYAAFDFRRYRGQPIDLEPLWTFLRAPFHGWYDRSGALIALSYLAGVLLAALWVAHALVLRLSGRRLLARDPSHVAPFLSGIAVFVTYAQSVRYSAANGGAVLPMVWAAWLSLRFERLPRLAPAAVAAAGVLVVLPVLEPYGDTITDIDRAAALNEAPEQVPKLEGIPVGTGEWSSMAGIHALWRSAGLRGEPVLATNKRNDLSYANGAYLYWFLDAPPAAWITTYDPGLDDRADVQRDVVADLCSNRAPVVEEDQDPTTSSNGEFGAANHRSRRLDESVALNYDSAAVVGFYRLRLRATPRCADPRAASEATIRARRERALRSDDMPQAGALSILLVERAHAAGRKPLPGDAAAAVMGGYWVPDDQLPVGPVRPVLTALRDRVPASADATLAAVRAPAGALTRLAVTGAYIAYRPPDASPATDAAVVAAMRAVLRDAPRWTAAAHNLLTIRPADVAFVARYGGDRLELERARFALARQGGDQRAALRSGLRLLPLLRRRPLDQGTAYGDVAAVLEAMDRPDCGARFRALGNSVPGVHLDGPQRATAPCRLPLVQPSLVTGRSAPMIVRLP